MFLGVDDGNGDDQNGQHTARSKECHFGMRMVAADEVRMRKLLDEMSSGYEVLARLRSTTSFLTYQLP
jgi:hypothetical protein